MGHGDAAAATGGVIDGEFLTTAGGLAVANLAGAIEGQERRARTGLLTVSDQAALIELVALRGHVLGCIADYEWAEERAEQLTRDAPADSVPSSPALGRGPYSIASRTPWPSLSRRNGSELILRF